MFEHLANLSKDSEFPGKSVYNNLSKFYIIKHEINVRIITKQMLDYSSSRIAKKE